MKTIRIGKRFVGDGEPLYFVADIAANHDGTLERAYRLIELAKEAGADAAKFQNFQAAKIVSRHGFEKLGGMSHQAAWKKPVFDVYQEASVPPDWTVLLKARCDAVGIDYFTSPYDFASTDHVDPYVEVYKIGSGDITWPSMLEHIASKGKPVMLATGASTLEDVERAMRVLQAKTDQLVLMQCNTNYTADMGNFKYINLNVLKEYARRWPNVVLGLSDHTHGHATVLGAIALGARVFEKHFTDDNERTGPDHRFAMNPQTWRNMVDRARELDLAMGDGVKRVEDNERDTAIVQRRALRFTRDITKGTILREGDLFPLRPIPRDGYPPFRIDEVLGKRIARDVQADDYPRADDLEQPTEKVE
jgi:N-acetylneuraminate synthase